MTRGDTLPLAGILGARFLGTGSLAPEPPPLSVSKKNSESRRFRHKNRGIPRMKPLLGRLLRDNGSPSRKNARSQKRPTRGLSRLYALPVGYLGFCAEIFLLECTFSGSLAQAATPDQRRHRTRSAQPERAQAQRRRRRSSGARWSSYFKTPR